MTLAEAITLLRPAVPPGRGTWADFGAGTGLFTRALAHILDPAGRVFAIDRDAGALSALRTTSDRQSDHAPIVPIRGDFQDLDAIEALNGVVLDGAVFANALHFAPDAGRVLAEVSRLLGEKGRVVVVEYDRRSPSRWVPYPLPIRQLHTLAARASLEAPRVVSEWPSAYGGVMYCAVLERAPGLPITRPS